MEVPNILKTLSITSSSTLSINFQRRQTLTSIFNNNKSIFFIAFEKAAKQTTKKKQSSHILSLSLSLWIRSREKHGYEKTTNDWRRKKRVIKTESNKIGKKVTSLFEWKKKSGLFLSPFLLSMVRGPTTMEAVLDWFGSKVKMHDSIWNTEEDRPEGWTISQN